MRIAVLLDAELVSPLRPGALVRARGVSPPKEQEVIDALRGDGHEVTVVPWRGDVLAALDHARPEVVFNLTEHVGGNRMRASDVSALLELLGFAYTGATSIGQTLSNDKAVSKQIARDLGIPVPEFEVLPVGTTRLRRLLRFPLLVKPRFGDGSEGITLRSLSCDGKSVARNARAIHEQMEQPAICETFIDGRELSVGIIGDATLKSFPVRETVYGTWRPGEPRFNTSTLKSSPAFRARYAIRSVRAEIPDVLERSIRRQCETLFRALALRDYARIDLRLDRDGKAYFIEANCNCDLKASAFGIMAGWAGIEYPSLLTLIAGYARRRRVTVPVELIDSRPLL